jgi:hypothetical protein
MTEEFGVKIGRVSLEGFSTDELVAELKTRHELCPVLDEMTRDPMCLFVTTTESLVKELSKRDGVEYADIECEDGIAKTIVIHGWKE